MSITITGAHGHIAPSIIETLSSDKYYPHLRHPIVVLTRDAASAQSTDRVRYVHATGPAEWGPTLKETEILIDVTGLCIDRDVFRRMLARYPPKVYIPSQFGIDIEVVARYMPNPVLMKKCQLFKMMRYLGCKVIEVHAGLIDDQENQLLELSLSAGLDERKQTFTPIHSLHTLFNTTNISDLANTLATIVAFHDLMALPDKLHIASSQVSFHEVILRYERQNSVVITLLPPIDIDEATEHAFQLSQNECFTTADLNFWIHVIASQGPGGGLHWDLNERELINPSERFFQWTPFWSGLGK